MKNWKMDQKDFKEHRCWLSNEKRIKCEVLYGVPFVSKVI